MLGGDQVLVGILRGFLCWSDTTNAVPTGRILSGARTHRNHTDMTRRRRPEFRSAGLLREEVEGMARRRMTVDDDRHQERARTEPGDARDRARVMTLGRRG